MEIFRGDQNFTRTHSCLRSRRRRRRRGRRRGRRRKHTHTHTHTHTHRGPFRSLVFLWKCRNKTKKCRCYIKHFHTELLCLTLICRISTCIKTFFNIVSAVSQKNKNYKIGLGVYVCVCVCVCLYICVKFCPLTISKPVIRLIPNYGYI